MTGCMCWNEGQWREDCEIHGPSSVVKPAARQRLIIDLEGSRLGSGYQSVVIALDRPAGVTDADVRGAAAEHFGVPLGQVSQLVTLAADPDPVDPDCRCGEVAAGMPVSCPVHDQVGIRIYREVPGGARLTMEQLAHADIVIDPHGIVYKDRYGTTPRTATQSEFDRAVAL